MNRSNALFAAKSKGSGSRIASLTMVFKLMESASNRWRVLNGSTLIQDLIGGIVFANEFKQKRVAT